MKEYSYFDGIQFLKEVTEKLKNRIEEIEQTLSEGQREIASIQEYYWENYAEMDQYGYEEYDNQQALFSQINTNQEKLLLKQRFEKMYREPFFGRVDFLFQGESEKEPFYIGIGNFALRAGMTPLIYDWRAPVCSLFYDADNGDAAYEAPSGTVKGRVCAKWQYKIRNGKMIYAFECDTKIDDEILQQELGQNGDIRLKNIVRTIQKEQNAIIRNLNDKILVIQGAAGSGKTSIALHRIAYLLYHDRKNLKSSNILILSPNSVFADYISHILPELGEENIQEMSFDVFAYHELKDIAEDCEDKYQDLERRMKYPDCVQADTFNSKQSAQFAGEIEGFLAVLEDELMEFKEITFKGMKLTEEELIRLFYFKFQDTPLLERMDAVMEYFVDSYETLYSRDISDEEKDYLKRKFDALYMTKDIYEIYNRLLAWCGMDTLPEVPYERRKLCYEDVYPMLYLKYRLKKKAVHKNIKHLVIDEMQDYSYIQYLILHRLFSCRMTILGDKAQTLGTEPQDVLKFFTKIFGKKYRSIEIKKSYRNTVEIAKFAERISGITDLELFHRHGKEVDEQQFQTEKELLDMILKNVSIGEDTYETAAILTMTEGEAWHLFSLLKKWNVHVNYVDRNSSTFQKGLTVTTFYLAKGLEFDQVFAVLNDDKNPLYKQAAYICATRALHELYMYQTGEKR